MNSHKKGITLRRVSDKDQLDGDSLGAQYISTSKYALSKDIEVISEYEFDESSIKKSRPKFDLIIKQIESTKEPLILIVDTVDRLQRSFKESVILDNFRKQGILEIHFIRENLIIHKDSSSSELQRWDMAVMFARNYVLQISDNVKRSFNEKVRKGEYPGHAPFGYVNIPKDKDKKIEANIEKHPLKSVIVPEMYKWYATGAFSMDLIRVKVFDSWGIKLHKSKVDLILSNPFYYGEMRVCGIIAPHRYDTLISKELFDHVQAVKASFKKKRGRTQGKIDILYRGILRCSACGCIISAEKKRKKSGRSYIYYQCTEFHGKHGAKRFTEQELTRQFSDYFNQIQIPDELVEAIQKDLRSSHQGKTEYQKTMRNHLEQEYSKLQNRIEKMYEDKLDGSITDHEHQKRLTRYRIEQRGIQEKLKNLHTADEDYYSTVNFILNLSRRMPQQFESSEVELKRRLINLVLLNPTLNDTTVCATIRKPFSWWAKGSSCSKWGG